MKYLLILGIVIGLIWWFKRGRRIDNTSNATYCSLEHRDLQESRDA
jgi:hypothetical protein